MTECVSTKEKHVFIEFVNLVVTYHFDPIVVHKEFLKLAEYCDGMNDGIIEEYIGLLQLIMLKKDCITIESLL